MCCFLFLIKLSVDLNRDHSFSIAIFPLIVKDILSEILKSCKMENAKECFQQLVWSK